MYVCGMCMERKRERKNMLKAFTVTLKSPNLLLKSFASFTNVVVCQIKQHQKEKQADTQ